MSSSHVRTPRRLVVQALAAALLVGPLAGCGPEGGSGDGAGAAAPTAATPTAGQTAAGGEAAGSGAPAEVELAVVGDSLTAAGAEIDSGTAIADGTAQPGVQSWLVGAAGAPLVEEGGWARNGARTADMLAGVTEYDADVLLVLAGTNDLLQGVPWEETGRNIEQIVERAGVDRVVLSAVPPADAQPQASTETNERLADLADEHGWQFADPWTDFELDGRYRPGSSDDGVHPTAMVAFSVGRALRSALLDGAGG